MGAKLGNFELGEWGAYVCYSLPGQLVGLTSVRVQRRISRRKPCCKDPCRLLEKWSPANGELNYAQGLIRAAKDLGKL